jgi:ribosome biogenesis GTPase
MKGTVVTLLGKACTVRAEGRDYLCHLRGRLFEKPDTQIAVGDEVEFDPLGDSAGPLATGALHALEARRTSLSRPATRRGGRPQVIAANVDQLVVVSALKDPPLRTGLLDRYLIIAHRAGLEAAICLNKMDLAGPGEREAAESRLRPYRDLGLPTVLTSARTGEGVDAFRDVLRGKRSVLAGHSGVGKSKLAGLVQPGLELASSEVGRKGKGRHTTSATRLVSLDFGGELVDTPGVRELGLRDLEREELALHFVDFGPYLDGCRFTSCSHIPEPDCAVKDAVSRGAIAGERYQSYVHLYHELTH